MIDLTPQQRATVEQILARHVPRAQVWAFGSRVTGGARPYSDLDLVVVDAEPLPLAQLYRLREEFEESNLPFRVDLLDWHRISPAFRAVIERDRELLFGGGATTPQVSQ